MQTLNKKRYKFIAFTLSITLFLFPSVIYFSGIRDRKGVGQSNNYVDYMKLQDVFDPYTDELSKTSFIRTFIDEYSIYAGEINTEFIFTFSDSGKISVSTIDDINKTQNYYYKYFV